jgi:hypothetical protein
VKNISTSPLERDMGAYSATVAVQLTVHETKWWGRMNRTIMSGVFYFSLLGGASYAADVPDIKPGLWATTTTSGDAKMPSATASMCSSTALLQALVDQRLKGPNHPCKRISVAHSGATITEQSECKFGDTVTRSKSVTVVTGNTAVHTEIRQEGKTTVIVSDSKYVGACPAGMQLGDFVADNGMKANILQPENDEPPPKKP